MLTIDRVSRRFGGVYANQDITLEVAEGELRGIIGPNGAGKSTLFNLIAGHIRPESGTISLGGRRIDRLPPHTRARRGIGIVFQGARIFPGMSLLANVMVGAHSRTRVGVVGAVLRSPAQRREERAIRTCAAECLDRVGLLEWASRPADERRDLAALIDELRRAGTTILLVEHDVGLVTALAQRITVLDLGRVIADGTPSEVTADPAVMKAYLGTGVTHAQHL
jgi:branched-chain amino acid transport system ATP-binding protein